MSPKRKQENDLATEPLSKRQKHASQLETVRLRTRSSNRQNMSVTVSTDPTPTPTDSRRDSTHSDSVSSSMSRKRKLDDSEDLLGSLTEIPSRSSVQGSPQAEFRERSTPVSVPEISIKRRGRKKRKTGNAEKLVDAIMGVTNKRPPGRQRVPKKNPRIEAFYIRMHELKRAFRDVTRAVLPALHELESRTETNIKTRPGYLEGSEEYKKVTGALDMYLENRKAVEKAILNQKVGQLKREREAAKQLIKDTYTRRTELIAEQLASHVKLDVMKVVASLDDDDTSSDDTVSLECENVRCPDLYEPSDHGWKKETGYLTTVQPVLPEDSVRYEPSVRYYQTNIPLYRLINECWDDWSLRAKMHAVLTKVHPSGPLPLPVQPRKKPIDCRNMEMLLTAACTVQEKAFIKEQGGMIALANAAEESGLDVGGEHLRKSQYEAKHGTLDEYLATLPAPVLPDAYGWSWRR